MLDTYQLNFAGLLGLCAVLFVAQRKPTQPKNQVDEKKPKSSQQVKKEIESSDAPQWPFLVVFALVMGSDWLQGPFLYSLYRDEHGVPSSLVSSLFTTGFVSGAISAYFSGSLADRRGRKAACLFFCAVYAVSCLLTVLPSVPLLFLGRVLGGVGTSLLFSVFESWMVTDFHSRELAKKGADLSRTFGLMSTINSVVAIVSGVFSEWVVAVTGTRKAPFIASVVLLGVAAWVISTRWAENYGDAAAKAKGAKPKQESKLWDLFKDPRIISLGLASTMFEGSMYLFVFFWTPALQSVQSTRGSLPYGIIFASFMACILAASLTFNIVMDRKLLTYTKLLLGILGVADVCLYLLESPSAEQATFWVFCLFEACVGMYWPCMGYLKGKLIDDGVRAQVYGILRIPLNVFVVVSLMLTADEDAFGTVFAACSRLLLLACGGIWAMVLHEEELP